MATISYKYGALWPKDWDDDCCRQMQLQTDLWNTLVNIHHETGTIIQALTPSTEELVNATALLEEIKLEIAGLQSRAKTVRIARYLSDKTKAATPSGDERARLGQLREALKEAARRRIELARQARAEAAAEQVVAAYDQQQQRFKDARQAAGRNGLWWGNYNAIMTSFDGARCHIAKAGGELKEKCFRGEGRLTVQIQGGTTAGEMFAPAGSSGRNEARLIDGPPPGWEDRRAGKTLPTPGSKRSQRRQLVTLAMTVYTGRDTDGKATRRLLHVPLVYDRPLPAAARVQQIVLTRRRGSRTPSGDWRYEVTFTLRVPEPATRELERIAAVHIGWRSEEDGIRVATVADRSGCSHLVLPTSIKDRFQAASDMMSAADSDAEAMRARITADWTMAGAPATIQADFESVRRARSGGAIARALRSMAENWRDHTPGYAPTTREALGSWSHGDLTARWMARNIQARTVRHRRDLVRVWVAGLATRYDAVIIQQYDIGRLRRRVVAGSALASSRRNIQCMAPGEVRATVAQTLKSRGVTVIGHSGKTTWLCHQCGTETAPSDPLAHKMRCPGCDNLWDVDDNAALNALAILSATVLEPREPPENILATDDDAEIRSAASPDSGRFGRRKSVAGPTKISGGAIVSPDHPAGF